MQLCFKLRGIVCIDTVLCQSYSSFMEQHTYQVLLRLNPWIINLDNWPHCIQKFLPDPFVPRLAELSADKNQVSLVIGPRQSGKTTFIRQFLSRQAEPCFYLNCEELTVRELCISPALFLEQMEDIGPKTKGFFFDEVQHLDNAGLFLKGLVDLKPDKKIIATGSSSYHLGSGTRESLAGRAIRKQILPFAFSELRPDYSAFAVQDMEEKKIWKDLLIWGSYPEVYLSREREDILSRLIEAFILRDFSDLYNIKNPQAFRRLLGLVASQVGNLANYSNWAEVLGISVNTVSQYLSLLEESHVIRLVPPYVGGKRAEITSRPKIYFLDNGVRNQLFGGFTALESRADLGMLMENLVFTELAKYTHPLLESIHFWRSSSQAEVDFVLSRKNELIALEVKSAYLQRIKISRSMRSFIQAYQPQKALIVNDNLRKETILGSTIVRFILGPDLEKELA